MFQTFSRPIGSTRLPQLAIVTSIVVTVVSPTAAQLPLLELNVQNAVVNVNLDFAPRFLPQSDGDSAPTGLGPGELIEATVQDGDLTSTGARSHGRAGMPAITTNAQFVIGGDLPAGSAASSADVRFDVINRTAIPREAFLDFFLPPALLEFSNNVESAGIGAFDEIQTNVTARLCRNGPGCTSQTFSNGDFVDSDFLFEFSATLTERYVPADMDAARIDYDLVVDVTTSDPQLNFEPLLTPNVVEEPQPGANTVTASFPEYVGTIRLFEVAANDTERFSYVMSAGVSGGGVASGIGPVSAIAAINDPVGVGPIVSIRSIPVPELSTLLLLVVAAPALGVYRH